MCNNERFFRRVEHLGQCSSKIEERRQIPIKRWQALSEVAAWTIDQNESDDEQEYQQRAQPAQVLPTAVQQHPQEKPKHQQLRRHQQEGL